MIFCVHFYWTQVRLEVFRHLKMIIPKPPLSSQLTRDTITPRFRLIRNGCLPLSHLYYANRKWLFHYLKILCSFFSRLKAKSGPSLDHLMHQIYTQWHYCIYNINTCVELLIVWNTYRNYLSNELRTFYLCRNSASRMYIIPPSLLHIRSFHSTYVLGFWYTMMVWWLYIIFDLMKLNLA